MADTIASQALVAGSGTAVAPSPARSSRRPVDRGLVVLLAAASCAASILVSTQVFPHFSVNNDEPVYVFQARMLLDGRLTLPATVDARFFRPWMSGQVGDSLVMVFPPVFPALLALGELLLGSMRLVLGLLAAAGVALVHRLTAQLTGDRAAARWAAFLLAVCPFFIIQSGLFLGYVLALDLELLLATCLAAGCQRSQLRWFVGAGAAAGLLAFARPLDAVLAGVPLVAAALLARAGPLSPVGAPRVEARWTRAARRAAAVALGAAPFVAASLLYNLAVTGSALRVPLDAVGGENGAGFGLRHVAAGTQPVDYTLLKAVLATRQNVGALAGWVPGGLALVALAWVGYRRLPSRAWARALALLALASPLGYLFYWGNLLIVNGRRAIGPHYYLALLIPLVVLSATALGSWLGGRRRASALVAVALAVTAGVSLDARVRLNREQVAMHERERALVDGAHLDHAVVFLPSDPPDGGWLGHPRPSFINDPDLRGPVLFAADRAGANFELLDRLGGRAPYRQLARVPPDASPPLAEPELWRLEPRRAAAYDLEQRVVNTERQPVVTSFVTDGRRRTAIVLDRAAGDQEAYRVTWRVTAGGAQLVGAWSDDGTPLGVEPLVDTLVGPLGTGTLAVGATFGPTGAVGGSVVVEERFWHRAREDGQVDLMLPGEVWWRGARPAARWIAEDRRPTVRTVVASTAAASTA